jgi:hypothetical protein
VTTQSGQINVEVDGVPYHSTYNPQREAQMFYRSHPVEEADVVLHFGWGLGYGSPIMRERLQTQRQGHRFRARRGTFQVLVGPG